jgi:hypothetical protein
MSRTCQFSFAGRSGPAEWSFDETALVVSPSGGRPLVFPIREVAGVAGDGYTIELTVPGGATAGATAGEPGGGAAATSAGTLAAGVAGAPPHPRLALAKLGAEGSTLLDAIQRSWLAARAKTLRLGGTGEGKPFSGMVTGMEHAEGGAPAGQAAVAAVAGPAFAAAVGAPGAPGAPSEPFRALLFEDVMVIAREGHDLDPLFISLTESIAFAEATYSLHVEEWPGRQIVFSKLGRQTQDLLDSLRKHRGTLADETGAALAGAVPSLASAYRGILAGDWPPGRLRTLQDLAGICPGFDQAFRTTWLAGCARKDQGGFLLDWAGPAGCWLGCSRETSETGEALLWLLAEKKGAWFLEALTGEDRATYRFAGGDEMPALVSRLLCAPQFSKEALYGGPEMLTGERADLAIAAQFLGFLAALRSRFRGRIIHASPEGWRKDMEAAAG